MFGLKNHCLPNSRNSPTKPTAVIVRERLTTMFEYVDRQKGVQLAHAIYHHAKANNSKVGMYFATFALGTIREQSGKGVPAALYMAEVTRMFRTLVDGRLSPNTIATRLNHALAEDNEQGMFVTMFIGLIDLKSGHMEFCNAGHNPPLLNGEFMKMESNAPIGLWPEVDFEGEKVDDMHGKTLFIYTDGINEAENIHKEQFGEERLQALLKKDLGDARQTSETIHKAVEEFVGEAEPSDDLTKMCIIMK